MDTAARPKDHALLRADASPGRADTAHQRLLLLRADHATSWDDVFAATMAVMYGHGGPPPAEGGAAAGHRRHGPHGEHVEHVEHAEHAEPADRRSGRGPARTAAAGPARAWPCRALRRAQRLLVRWSAARGRRHGAPETAPELKRQPLSAPPVQQQEGPAAPRRPFWAGRGCM